LVRPFFNGLVKYMDQGPVVAMCWEGENAVKTGKKELKVFRIQDPDLHQNRKSNPDSRRLQKRQFLLSWVAPDRTISVFHSNKKTRIATNKDPDRLTPKIYRI
jgi:hypothetical protein